MEGGSRFEIPRYRPETPQQIIREQIRGELNAILRSTEDPLAYEIGLKIEQKLGIKDHLEIIERYRNDPTIYQQWKQLGIFIVVDSTSRIDWMDENSGFKIQKGERILDIHLPPVSQDQRNLSTVTDSLEQIAEYIKLQNLDPKYIMGVTFEKLAKVSRRQGFSTIEPELPEDIRRGVENVYRRFNDQRFNEESLGKILLCYQDTKQFLEKFASK